MSSTIAAAIERAIPDMAANLDGSAAEPGSWFDGFWDFVVDHRARWEREPAWAIHGVGSGRPWMILMMASPTGDRAALELHLFVEAKSREPGVRAPWPVSSLALPGDEPALLGARDAFDRVHDPSLAQALRDRGFDPKIGYWGVRCDRSISRHDAEAIVQVDALLAALLECFRLALALAADLESRDSLRKV